MQPFDKQAELIDAIQKRKIVRAGRRGGKTSGLSILAVESLMERENRVLYAVPTADQMGRFWHEVVQSMAELIEFGVVKKYESDHIIEYPGTEKRIKAKTAWNADTLRGDYGDLIILDEFQFMNEDTLDVVVYPMLADNNGDLVLIYTPPRFYSRSTSKATDKRHAAKLYKAKIADPRWLCMSWTSHDNPHVSKQGLAEIAQDMTALAYRQEIMAEDIDEVPGALWTQKVIDDSRVPVIPQKALPLKRIVVGVDPSGGKHNFEVGIVAAALGADDEGYLLEDKSLLAPSPRTWAAEVTFLYYDVKADRVLGEENYGGQMVETTIKMHDENISYKAVRATRGKLVRAEPICAIYEKHRIHHVGDAKKFAKLEEEMCSYVPGGPSPNRMDAMVWCFTALFPEGVRLTLTDLQLEEIKEVDKIKQSPMIKPVTNENTQACPACGSKAINKRGPIFHCAQCSHEWGNSPRAEAVGGRSGPEFRIDFVARII